MKVLLLLTLSILTVWGETGFLDRAVTVKGRLYPYQVYVPRDFDANRKWPMVLFLHGVGQRGTDGLQQTALGLPQAIRLNPRRYGAVVVMPQAPMGTAWIGDALEGASAALDQAIREWNGDELRIHLTGMSMGGLGALLLAMQQPERWASISVLCAALEIPRGPMPPDLQGLTVELPTVAELAKALRLGTPLKMVAGGKDKLVPPERVELVVEGLRSAGHVVDYQVLSEANHNVWDPVYQSEGFAKWLEQQRLAGKPH